MCDIGNTHICLESVTDDCDVFTDVCSIHVLDHGPGCFLPKPRLLFCALLCKYTMQIVTYHIPSIYMHVGLSVFSPCCKIFMWECFFCFHRHTQDQMLGCCPLAHRSTHQHFSLFCCTKWSRATRWSDSPPPLNHLYFSWAVSQLLCLYNNKCVA